MEEEKLQPEIHIQSKISPFGKKSFVFVKTRSSKHVFFWTITVILIGVSVPYFLVDAGEKAYHRIALNFGFEKEINITRSPFPNLGSDEASDIDTPIGPDVRVNPSINGQYYFLGPNYKQPITSGQAFVVADIDTGEVIIEKNPDAVFPIASVSKLITALVAKQYMNLRDIVTVSRSSVEIYGTAGGLRTGEKILVNDLFYPLLIESSNDAAEVLAENFGYDEFIKHMNEKAKELDMTSTSFFEPSGLSENNVSTVYDLLKLVQHISKYHPDIWDISRIRQYAILKHSWGNASQLSRKSNFVGGKNGYTDEAHYTTASIFDALVDGGVRRFAVILLKSNSRENDVNALLSFLSKWVGFLPDGQELNDN
ncbi:MAG TPA: serine hydrolase [Candidatus Paceibacterota bacterium]